MKAPSARLIFDQVLDLPPEKRESYIAQACGGNEELRSDVMELVAEYQGLGGFLQTPTVSDKRPPGESVGAVIGRYRLLQDQLEIFDRYDASWALWTYKDIGLQGVVTVDPDSDYLRRIRPVLEKKARLGVDSWGSTDRDIRHLIEPIEQLFATEFPRFAPYPWGAPRWIAGHVRHVMLAEAMVDEYAASFAGISPEEAAHLADAFRFDRCTIREPLARILATATAESFPV